MSNKINITDDTEEQARHKLQTGGSTTPNDPGEQPIDPLNPAKVTTPKANTASVYVLPKMRISEFEQYNGANKPVEFETLPNGKLKVKGGTSYSDKGPFLDDIRGFNTAGASMNFPDEGKGSLAETNKYGVDPVWGTNFNKELDQARYDQSGGWYGLKNTWSAVANIGTGVLFGIGETAGYLYEAAVPRYGHDAIYGGDIPYDFNNDFLTWMGNAKQTVKEAIGGGEIYTQPTDNPWSNITSPTSWIATASDLGESIGGFAVGGAGIAGIMGKAAKIATAITKSSAAVERGLNLVGRAATAGTLAYVEGAMTGAQVFKDVYNKLRDQKGMSHEEALARAQRGAIATVQLNTVINTALNFTSLNSRFRSNMLNNVEEVAQRNLDNAIRGVDKSGAKIKGMEGLPSGKSIDDQIARVTAMDATKAGARNTWRDVAKDAAKMETWQEGLEEITNVLAEKAGHRYAETSGKEPVFMSDLARKFGSINLGDAFTTEGIQAFGLGMLGAIGQQMALEAMPASIGKTANLYTGSEGKPVMYKNEKGDMVELQPGDEMRDAEGNVIKSRKSARVTEDQRRQIAYNRARVALLHDLEDIKRTERAMQAVRDDKGLSEGQRQAKLDQLSEQMFGTETLRSARVGQLNNLRASYEFIRDLDNNTSIGDTLDKRIEAEEKKLQNAKDDDERAGIQKSVAYFKSLRDAHGVDGKIVTDAMSRGFAKDASDNEYKKKAQESLDRIDEYEKLLKELDDQYNYGDAESLNHTSRLYQLKLSSNQFKRLIDKEERSKDERLAERLELLKTSKPNADRILSEMSVMQAEIEAKANVYANLVAEINEQLDNKDIEGLYNTLKRLYPQQFMEEASKHGATVTDIIKAVLKHHHARAKVIHDAIVKDIAEIKEKKKAKEDQLKEIIAFNEGTPISEMDSAQLDALKADVDAKFEKWRIDATNNPQLTKELKDIERYRMEHKLAEDAFNHLASSKGRKAFIEASDKYWSRIFKEMAKQEKDKKSESKTDTGSSTGTTPSSGGTSTPPTSPTSSTSPGATGNKITEAAYNTDEAAMYGSLSFSLKDDESNLAEYMVAMEKSNKEFGVKLAAMKSANRVYTVKGLLNAMRDSGMGDFRYTSNPGLVPMLMNIITQYGDDVVVELVDDTTLTSDGTVFNKAGENNSGLYLRHNNKIYVNISDKTSYGQTVATLIHELVHHRIERYTDKSRLMPALSNFMLELGEAFTGSRGATHKDAIDAIKKKLEIQYNASSDRKERAMLKSAYKALEYVDKAGLDELVTQAFENTYFAEWLNSIKTTSAYTPKVVSFWSKLRDMFLALIGVTPGTNTYYTKLASIMDDNMLKGVTQSRHLETEAGQTYVNPDNLGDEITIQEVTPTHMVKYADKASGSVVESPKGELDNRLNSFMTLATYRVHRSVNAFNLTLGLIERGDLTNADKELGLIDSILEDNRDRTTSVNKLSDNQLVVITNMRTILENAIRLAGTKKAMSLPVVSDTIREIVADDSKSEEDKKAEIDDLVVEHIKSLDTMNDFNQSVQEIARTLEESKVILGGDGLADIHVKMLSLIDAELAATKDVVEAKERAKRLMRNASGTGTTVKENKLSKDVNAIARRAIPMRLKHKLGDTQDYAQVSVVPLDDTKGATSYNGDEWDHPYKSLLGGVYVIVGQEGNEYMLRDLFDDTAPTVTVSDRYVYKLNNDNVGGDQREKLYYPSFVNRMFHHAVDEQMLKKRAIASHMSYLEEVVAKNVSFGEEDVKESGVQFINASYDTGKGVVLKAWEDARIAIADEQRHLAQHTEAIEAGGGDRTTIDKAIEVARKNSADIISNILKAYKLTLEKTKGVSDLKKAFQNAITEQGEMFTLWSMMDKSARISNLRGLAKAGDIDISEYDDTRLGALTIEEMFTLFTRVRLTDKIGATPARLHSDRLKGSRNNAKNKLKQGLLLANTTKQTSGKPYIAIHRWMRVDPLVEIFNDKSKEWEVVGFVNEPHKYHIVNPNGTTTRRNPADMWKMYEKATDDASKQAVMRDFYELYEFNEDIAENEATFKETADEFKKANEQFEYLVSQYPSGGDDVYVPMSKLNYTLTMTAGSLNFHKHTNQLSVLLANKAYSIGLNSDGEPTLDKDGNPVYQLITYDKRHNTVRADIINKHGVVGDTSGIAIPDLNIETLRSMTGAEDELKEITRIEQDKRDDEVDADTETNANEANVEFKATNKSLKKFYVAVRDLKGNIRYLEVVPADMETSDGSELSKINDKLFGKGGAMEKMVKLIQSPGSNLDELHNMNNSLHDNVLKSMFIATTPMPGKRVEVYIKYNLLPTSFKSETTEHDRDTFANNFAKHPFSVVVKIRDVKSKGTDASYVCNIPVSNSAGELAGNIIGAVKSVLPGVGVQIKHSIDKNDPDFAKLKLKVDPTRPFKQVSLNLAPGDTRPVASSTTSTGTSKPSKPSKPTKVKNTPVFKAETRTELDGTSVETFTLNGKPSYKAMAMNDIESEYGVDVSPLASMVYDDTNGLRVTGVTRDSNDKVVSVGVAVAKKGKKIQNVLLSAKIEEIAIEDESTRSVESIDTRPRLEEIDEDNIDVAIAHRGNGYKDIATDKSKISLSGYDGTTKYGVITTMTDDRKIVIALNRSIPTSTNPNSDGIKDVRLGGNLILGITIPKDISSESRIKLTELLREVFDEISKGDILDSIRVNSKGELYTAGSFKHGDISTIKILITNKIREYKNSLKTSKPEPTIPESQPHLTPEHWITNLTNKTYQHVLGTLNLTPDITEDQVNRIITLLESEGVIAVKNEYDLQQHGGDYTYMDDTFASSVASNIVEILKQVKRQPTREVTDEQLERTKRKECKD